MKLSLVFELLMIFVLLAFAASKSIKNKKNNRKGIQNRQDDDIKIEDNGINKYCKCSDAYCNCCRDFALPLVNLNGPGCASLMYLSGDKMSVSLRFGNRVITNRTLSSNKPSPVCMPLPGGISKFCGRVYNIARAGEDFRACLGLELQSKSTLEAAIRVSCFKFGSRGVTSEPADPLPLVPQTDNDDDDDDDDDDDEDDDFGLDDDDDGRLKLESEKCIYDDDEYGLEDYGDDDLAAVNDVGSSDYTGFSLLGEDLLGDLFGSSGSKKPNKNKNKNKKKQAPLATSTTKRPRTTRRPTRRPATRVTTPRTTPTRTTTVRVRPASTRKPQRRPTRRPRPTRTTTVSPLTQGTTLLLSSSSMPTVPEIQTTDRIQLVSFVPKEPTSETSKPPKTSSTMSFTTQKPVTNFEDPGLQLSLASITGQLSEMPVTPIISSKDSSVMSTVQEANYEKIQTITPRPMTTLAMFTSASVERDSGESSEGVQIVQSLDSESAENSVEKQQLLVDESRAQQYGWRGAPVPNGYYEGLSLNKNKKRNNDYGDYDVLGLTEMGEAIGETVGMFGRRRRQNIFKEGKVKNEKDRDNDTLGLSEISETLGLDRADKPKGRGRARQNKMMKEWSVA